MSLLTHMHFCIEMNSGNRDARTKGHTPWIPTRPHTPTPDDICSECTKEVANWVIGQSQVYTYPIDATQVRIMVDSKHCSKRTESAYLTGPSKTHPHRTLQIPVSENGLDMQGHHGQKTWVCRSSTSGLVHRSNLSILHQGNGFTSTPK